MQYIGVLLIIIIHASIILYILMNIIHHIFILKIEVLGHSFAFCLTLPQKWNNAWTVLISIVTIHGSATYDFSLVSKSLMKDHRGK